MDPKDQPEESAPDQDQPEKKGEATAEEDDSASVLFFGGHLKELVEKDIETKQAEPEDLAEATLESPSMMFFGESLEASVAREDEEREDEEGDDEDAP